MSYHSKQNAGQRSLGLVFVVVFHIILIWAFASGLANRMTDRLPEILKVKQVEEKQEIEKVEPPPPPPPEKAPKPDNIPLPPIDFAIESPPGAETITVTHDNKPAAPPPPPSMTKARPDPKKFSKPDYPVSSIRLGEEGVTGLNIYVLEDGKVGQIEVRQSSGFEKLDEAVVKHGERSWKFIPCMQGDKPVACWYQINYRWKLDDAKK